MDLVALSTCHALEKLYVRYPDVDVISESVLQDLVHFVDPPRNRIINLVFLVLITDFLRKEINISQINYFGRQHIYISVQL